MHTSATTQPSAADGRIWANALANILAAGGPELVAQPIVDLSAGRIAGYELLARFDAEPRATPDVWFATADRHGLAGALTAQVLRQALDLRHGLPPDTFLTVNVEPHLLTEPEVDGTLREAGSLDRIVIELTEHTQAPDERALLAALDRSRSAGALIAVDDAGTGYAGLRQLLAIRPDIVKLDRELVSGLDADPIRRALVQLLGDLTGRMDAWLLAEGIETLAELQSLAALDVPLGQGWLLGRPAPPWADLTEEAALAIFRSARAAELHGHVTTLVRERPTMADTDDWRAAGPGAVVLDQNGRPVGVVATDMGGETVLAPAMTVAPSSPPMDLARRALAREPRYRGIPVVCTDSRGRVIGLIDIADLVDAAFGSVPADAGR